MAYPRTATADPLPGPVEPWYARYLKDVWTYLTSPRVHAVVGGVLLLCFRERLGIDDDTAKSILSAILVAVVGVSLRKPNTVA